ncbi:MAG TPA: YciI family protein [Bacteroidales bacterium]|nr:YciI family protein [Bacteroidales bacterium]
MNYVVIHHMLRKDVTEDMMQPHVEYLKELFNKGKLIITGPFLDEKRGGMFVIDVESEEELMDIVHNDPAIKHGISKSEVRPYKIVFRDNK